jgi:hypothetical protein
MSAMGVRRGRSPNLSRDSESSPSVVRDQAIAEAKAIVISAAVFSCTTSILVIGPMVLRKPGFVEG